MRGWLPAVAPVRRQLFGGLPQLQVLQFKDVALYPQECRVLVRGGSQPVSQEFRLLELF